MNAQEIFDTVVTHLRSMKERSGEYDLSGEFRCLYRGPNGSMCAVGVLLKDDEYSPYMENYSADNIPLPERLKNHEYLLTDLQDIHDKKRHWNENGFCGNHALKEIARNHSLEYKY